MSTEENKLFSTLSEFLKRLKFPKSNNKIYFSKWFLYNLLKAENNNMDKCFQTLKELKLMLEKIDPNSLKFEGYLRGRRLNKKENLEGFLIKQKILITCPKQTERPTILYKPYLKEKNQNSKIVEKFYEKALFCILESLVKNIFLKYSQIAKKKIDKFILIIDLQNLNLTEIKKEVKTKKIKYFVPIFLDLQKKFFPHILKKMIFVNTAPSFYYYWKIFRPKWTKRKDFKFYLIKNFESQKFAEDKETQSK